MKKTLHFLLLILANGLLATVSAQENYRFQVQFGVLDATCYNNGKVVYSLTDSAGAVLDSLPHGYSQVRAYYKQSIMDSVQYAGWYYTGGTDTLTVNYGTYIVGVEALVTDGSGGYVRADTQTVFTINTTYQKPTATLVSYQARSRSHDRGTLFTVPCMDIGRVQLNILGGQFPYIVKVTNHAGDTVRTEVFEQRQYDGTNVSAYNYKDYYSIDSLSGGAWTFLVEDGCGYGLPQIVETVETQGLPYPMSIGVHASSGNFSDSNVVKLSVYYYNTCEGLHELMHQYVSYRFLYNGVATGDWHQMPYDTTIFRTLLASDTVDNIGKYCDIWGRDITFEYKVSGCGSTSRFFTFQYNKPNETYFEKDSIELLDSVRMEDGNCVRVEYVHNTQYAIRYYRSGLFEGTYAPGCVTLHNDHEYYRYHYTHPLTWVYTDLRTGAVFKRDTIEIITDKTFLTDEEVHVAYGLPLDSTLIIPTERKLMDAKGCVLYITNDTLAFRRKMIRETVCWQVDSHDDGDKCCIEPRRVRVFRASDFGPSPDSTVIRLKRSPLRNLYNFEAIYHAAEQKWTVVKDSFGNTAAITGNIDGKELIISDYCLPSGPYEFEVVTACGTTQVSEKVPFNDYMEMQVGEEIECVSERDCSNLFIHYPRGAFQWVKTNTSPETGLPIDTVRQNVGMKAVVVAAPNSSFIGNSSYYNPQFTFSMPGTYVLQICPNIAVDECSSYACYYDTFHLEAATVEFEEAFAVVCDTSSTEGDAWVRAGHGMPPYQYTLYDQPNKQGNILAINNSGVFQNVPMRSNQTLSCLVQDSCNAYFHVNFQPSSMAELQKLWFEGGLTATTACEGTTIQIHALAIGNIWQYEWSGPGGFCSTSSDPYVFVPRGNGDGWYRVIIRQTDCAGEIRDSIYLTTLTAPKLSLSPDTTVCPGETVNVRFTPHGEAASGNIPFSVAFASTEGVSVRHYSAPAEGTVVDTFTTRHPAKIYPVSIHDDRCDYLLADPEDTLYIHLRTDIAQTCQIITTHDTVCSGGRALLTARATDSAPYILRWYGDYGQTQLLKTDVMTDGSRWSLYDTAGIFRQTLLYVSLQKGTECPSVNGLTDSVMAMNNGETVLACGRHIRFYDPGGAGESSGGGEYLIHRFRTSDSTRVSLHFDRLSLHKSAHLLMFSGVEPLADSLLLDLTYGSVSPQVVLTSGNVLTVLFMGQQAAGSDWSAVVETAPGIAVADVWGQRTRVCRDEVCQSQTNNYDDPYGMVPEVVSAEELGRAVRKAGNYYYSRTYSSVEHSCDSTVIFTLTVNPPTETEMVATTTRQAGFRWHDSVYTENGRHAVLSTTSDGCDHLDVLHLTVLDVDCPNREICRGDSTTLSVSASLSTSFRSDTLLPRRARPGDVLCTDGSLISADSFLTSGKFPKGVVFFVDETGVHGLAMALAEDMRSFMNSTPLFIMNSPCYNYKAAAYDADGEANTLHLMAVDDAYSRGTFMTDESAVSYCYYYNHNTLLSDNQHHGWFLPSVYEINVMLSHLWDVKQTLNKLHQYNSRFMTFNSNNYWSSTLGYPDYAWQIQGTSWYEDNISVRKMVRPVTKF